MMRKIRALAKETEDKILCKHPESTKSKTCLKLLWIEDNNSTENVGQGAG
jgi:hypothetical protein